MHACVLADSIYFVYYYLLLPIEFVYCYHLVVSSVYYTVVLLYCLTLVFFQVNFILILSLDVQLCFGSQKEDRQEALPCMQIVYHAPIK